MSIRQNKKRRNVCSLGRLVFVALILAARAWAAEPVEVLIYGLDEISEARENVQKALALPSGLVQDNRVNSVWLERFSGTVADRARLALEPYGYYHATVRSVMEKTGENSYRIVVHIAPGEPVRIAEASVRLRGPGSAEQALIQQAGDFPFRPGDVLLQPKYEAAKAQLRSRAVELGYLNADFSVHTIEVDRQRLSASINLELDTGPRYYFGTVRFEGAPRYPEKFLNRYVAFKPGDIFSYARLGETQLNLLNSDRFKEVFPVPEKESAVNGLVPVVMHMQEAPTKRLRPGIGYATDLGPRFTLEYRDLNVFDRGQEFRSELNLSGRQQNAGAEYRLPDAVNIQSFTGAQVNFKREEVEAYTTQNFSLELNRTKSFRQGRIGTVYIRLEQDNSTVAHRPVDSRLVLPGIRFSERRYDSLTRPRKGRSYTIDLRGTDQALGANTRFLQVVADGSLLLPLAGRLSLIARAGAGATFQHEAVEDLPVSYRFFAGGDRSVRGYSYQSLGPVNAFGEVVGGTNRLTGSLELEQALSVNWGVAGFYDAGNAFNSFDDFRLFKGAGVGVRYFTVVGAVRLDIARQIGVPDPGYRIHLSVGFAF
jgi:translocation and assembly module TamA